MLGQNSRCMGRVRVFGCKNLVLNSGSMPFRNGSHEMHVSNRLTKSGIQWYVVCRVWEVAVLLCVLL